MPADRSVLVRLRANVSDFNRNIATSTAAVSTLESRLRAADKEGGASIDRLSGRLRVLAEVAAVAGQSLGPLGGVAIAGLAGLTSQLGFAAVAGGVLIGSLQGVGDALDAMNKAQLEPTEKNLQKAHDALKALSPAARDFAKEAFALKPALVALRDMGAESLIPGLSESLDSLERLGPRVGGIFEAIGGALGEIASDSAASLASERWQGFFEFIRDEAPDALSELASSVGSVVHGMAELWGAFTPLNDDFSSWLKGTAAGFDAWATGLGQTETFQEFIDYVRTTGPQVEATFGDIANALVQIVQASEPLGGPVLAGFEAIANAIAAIADSDLGTPIMGAVTALALLNRTLAVTASLSKVSLSTGLFAGLGTLGTGAKQGQGALKGLGTDLATLSRNYLTAGAASERMAAQNRKALDGIKGTARAIGPTAGILGGLAIASTGAADAIGLTNTMSLALAGSWLGAPGAAVGAAAGLLLDLKSAGEGATVAIDGLAATAQSGNITALKDQIAAAKNELADISHTDMSSIRDIAGQIGFSVADTFGGTSADDARQKIEDAEQAVEHLTKAQQLNELQNRASAMAYASSVGLNSELAVWSRKSTEEIKAQADALKDVADAGRKTGESFLGFGDSLNDSKVSLSKFISDMQESADALVNFNTNSLKAARNGLDKGLILSLRDAGEEGALRMKQLANATEDEIARANKAHRSQTRALEQTEDVTIRLAGYAPVVKVRAETGAAVTSIRSLEAKLRAIKDEDVFVNVRHRQYGKSGGFGPVDSADGGMVPKDGGPYSDRFLYRLAPGEEIISNRHGQADAFRADRAAGRIPGYADGGTTGKKPRPAVGGLYEPMTLKALRQLAEAADRQLEAANAQHDAAQSTLESLKAQRDSFADAVSSAFKTSLTGGGLAGLDRALFGDISRGGAFDSLLQQLVGTGLDTTGPASGLFQELAASGDTTTVQQLLAAGPGAIDRYEQAYMQRDTINANRSAFAADSVYGRAIADQTAVAQDTYEAQIDAVQKADEANRRLERLERLTEKLIDAQQEAHERTGKALGDKINSTASSAAQKKPKKHVRVGGRA